ncbi:DUF4376 domain-containing protein [Telmatospirillum sp. J64-1]|uniref:DUF4376 domain-containing protein n=1 Tax=Telmatospirillum sp. J64-1 TaxID=2502183 RepID=UPI00115CFB4F|nr:DUF4376 domain-containing protein [Telmatospirillum sp. J64-1]
MEYGFYHPDRGYWQATGEVPEDIRESYPEGTIEVPLRPSPHHEWKDGEWVAGPAQIDPAQLRAAIDAERDRRLALGYRHDFGGDVGVQVLQTRDLTDRTNWLTLDASAKTLVAAGHGDMPLSIRTEANVVIQVTAAEAVSIMAAMAQHGAAIMAASWALKDALERGEEVDITQGWHA